MFLLILLAVPAHASMVSFTLEGVMTGPWSPDVTDVPVSLAFSYESETPSTFSDDAGRYAEYEFTTDGSASLTVTVHGQNGPVSFGSTAANSFPFPLMIVLEHEAFPGETPGTFESQFAMSAYLPPEIWPAGVPGPPTGGAGFLTMNLFTERPEGQAMFPTYASLPTSFNGLVSGSGLILPDELGSEAYSFRIDSQMAGTGAPAVPEPGAALLLGCGLTALGIFGRRSFRKS